MQIHYSAGCFLDRCPAYVETWMQGVSRVLHGGGGLIYAVCHGNTDCRQPTPPHPTPTQRLRRPEPLPREAAPPHSSPSWGGAWLLQPWLAQTCPSGSRGKLCAPPPARAARDFWPPLDKIAQVAAEGSAWLHPSHKTVAAAAGRNCAPQPREAMDPIHNCIRRNRDPLRRLFLY